MEIKKQKSSSSNKEKTEKKSANKIWLGSYLIAAIAFIAFYFLLRMEIFNLSEFYKKLLQNISLAVFFAIIILSVSKGIEMVILARVHSKSAKYNLVRVAHLVSIVAIALVVITFLFKNWYAAAVSLGLFSLILGFALQTPISSFIGWIYIIIRNPYHIGDRIQIDTFKGDVVEITYLDTTLWEFAGDYLTNDLPSGRLIRFPNSLIFQSAVINYSWKDFQFIWNEIPFHVSYESDFKFIEKTMREVTAEALGPDVSANIKKLQDLVSRSPVDEMEIKEYPYVSFRTNANTWVEATVTYLVSPKKASTFRTSLVTEIIEALLKQPQKVGFPKGNNR
jgi:small-conductance mechanosensitive channel